jgi:ankyrin repeat protein
MKISKVISTTICALLISASPIFAELNEDSLKQIQALKNKINGSQAECKNEVIEAENSLIKIEPIEPAVKEAKEEDIFDIITFGGENTETQLIKHLHRFPKAIKLRTNGGYTPLHKAADWSKRPVIIFLIKSGVDVNALTDNNLTALDLANKENADVLQEYGAKTYAGIVGQKEQPKNLITTPSTRNSNRSSKNYATNIGPRGGVYHYSKSGKKVYHKKR